MSESVKPVVQDIRTSPMPDDVVVYHTHGLRQYMGTCKLHATPECPHLRHWSPGGTGPGGTGPGGKWLKLAKVVMMNNYRAGQVRDSEKCKTCWKK